MFGLSLLARPTPLQSLDSHARAIMADNGLAYAEIYPRYAAMNQALQTCHLQLHIPVLQGREDEFFGHYRRQLACAAATAFAFVTTPKIRFPAPSKALRQQLDEDICAVLDGAGREVERAASVEMYRFLGEMYEFHLDQLQYNICNRGVIIVDAKDYALLARRSQYALAK